MIETTEKNSIKKIQSNETLDSSKLDSIKNFPINNSPQKKMKSEFDFKKKFSLEKISEIKEKDKNIVENKEPIQNDDFEKPRNSILKISSKGKINMREKNLKFRSSKRVSFQSELRIHYFVNTKSVPETNTTCSCNIY